MYIVEWTDQAGDPDQMSFNNKADAEREAAQRSEEFGNSKAAVVVEIDI